MELGTNQAYQGSASGYGSWLEVGTAQAWSMQAVNLEPGSSIEVFGSNEPFLPTPFIANPNAVALGTMTPNANGAAIFQGVGLIHWVQVQKIAGGAPVLTNVWLLRRG